jgi:hypothetical protein
LILDVASRARFNIRRHPNFTMNRYDPDKPPVPEKWLALDEQERSMLVEEYHRRAKIRLPHATLHATVHTIVENQLAEHDEPVVQALLRLMKQGLSRHDAIHAIGSVVAEHIFGAVSDGGDTKEGVRARYYAAVEGLTAAKWLRGQ